MNQRYRHGFYGKSGPWRSDVEDAAVVVGFVVVAAAAAAVSLE